MSEPDEVERHGPRPPDPPPRPASPSLLERARAAPVTYGFAAIDIAVFALLEAKGSTFASTEPGTLMVGAVEPLHVWAGEYWRLASYMFLHIGWLHLVWNLYMSVGMCATIEQAIGKRRFFLVYLLSGIGGACVSVMFTRAVSAGASGALFGVIGAGLALRRRELPTLLAFWQDGVTRSILINIAIWSAIGQALNVNHAAHFGGLVIGFASTWVLTSKYARLEWIVFAFGFGSILVAACRPWWKPRGGDLETFAAYANAHLDGAHGFSKDVARGVRFSEKACALGSGSACVNLGVELHRRKDPALDARVAELFQAACDGGEPYGCMNVAGMYRAGSGVAKDDAHAAQLYKGACDAGLAMACGMLGTLRYQGIGVPRDAKLAVQLFHKACAAGDPSGCAGEGLALIEGRGVAADGARGIAMIDEACTKGSAWACSLAPVMRDQAAAPDL